MFDRTALVGTDTSRLQLSPSLSFDAIAEGPAAAEHDHSPPSDGVDVTEDGWGVQIECEAEASDDYGGEDELAELPPDCEYSIGDNESEVRHA